MLLLPGIESRFAGHPAGSTLTELTRLTNFEIRNLLEPENALIRGMFVFLCISTLQTRLMCSHNRFKKLTLHTTHNSSASVLFSPPQIIKIYFHCLENYNTHRKKPICDIKIVCLHLLFKIFFHSDEAK